MTRKGPDDAVLYRPAGADAGLPIRLVVRTQGAALPMTQRLQAAALSAGPDARIADVMSLDWLAEEEALTVRFFLRIFAVVGAVALLLSTAGIYALIAFTLARSTREIGIRVALGAAPWRIITSVFARAFSTGRHRRPRGRAAGFRDHRRGRRGRIGNDGGDGPGGDARRLRVRRDRGVDLMRHTTPARAPHRTDGRASRVIARAHVQAAL